jgi:hypothetical protein
MAVINLQDKTTAEKGKVEVFWFENLEIGLERTLFHRIHIPLKPFDSGIEKDKQPVKTKIIVDWLNLNLNDPIELDKLILKSGPEDDTQVSILIGKIQNPCDLMRMAITKVKKNLYDIDCEILVDFEHQEFAENETFKFQTQVVLDPKIKEE